MPASAFLGRTLRPDVTSRVAQVAAVIAANPGLIVEVDDNGDGGTAERAEAARATLIGSGAPAGAISTQSMGSTRPSRPIQRLRGAKRTGG